MSKEKGGLIKKKKTTTLMPPAIPVKKNDMDFNYSAPTKQDKLVTSPEVFTPIIVKTERKNIESTKSRPKTGVGKTNSTKSLKVPTVIHREINLLGSFMDENKTYVILQKLIDSYVKNELTNRQQRQFEFMIDALNEED